MKVHGGTCWITCLNLIDFRLSPRGFQVRFWVIFTTFELLFPGKAEKPFFCQDRLLYKYLIFWTQFCQGLYWKAQKWGNTWVEMCVLESQRSWSEATSYTHQSKLPLEAGREVCSESCLVEFWKPPRMEIEHPFQVPLPQCSGDDFLFLFSWNFSAAAWECCLSSCPCSSEEGLPLPVLPFPSSKELNKTNLLGRLLVCFPLSASLVSVLCEWLTAEPCLCIWVLSKKDLVSI